MKNKKKKKRERKEGEEYVWGEREENVDNKTKKLIDMNKL
jgi:hypothetical protein